MAELFFDDLCASLLSSGETIRFRATGQSMHPTIRDGETIIVEPMKPAEVKVSDIIFYRADRGVIAHRVVAMTRTEGRGLREGVNRTEVKGLSDEQDKSFRGSRIEDGESNSFRARSSILDLRSSKLNPPSSAALLTNFVARGDASVDGDESVNAERILGKVVAVERHGRTIKLEGRRAKMFHGAYLLAARLRNAVRRRLAAIGEQKGLRTEL